MKLFLGILIGLFLGHLVFNKLDIYSINCNPSKYSDTFITHENLEQKEFSCLNNTMKIQRITDPVFKLKWIKMNIEVLIYEIKHLYEKI